MKKLLLLVSLSLGSVGFAQELFGDWIYIEDIDLITDENTSFIVADASDYPSLARYSGVVIRCDASMSNGVEVFLSADRYLGRSAGSDLVTYRFDRDDPITETWFPSTDREALFAPDRVISGFLSRLNNAEQLVFRVSSTSETFTYVVPVAGFNDALYRLGCYTGHL